MHYSEDDKAIVPLPNPADATILDLNVVVDWSLESLKTLSKKTLLVIPECLWIEVITKSNQNHRIGSIRRLASLRCVLAHKVGLHCLREIRDETPVGLLLFSSDQRISPQDNARQLLSQTQRDIKASQDPKVFEDIRRWDKEDRDFWQKLHSWVIDTLGSNSLVQQAVRQDQKQFLHLWSQERFALRREFSKPFHAWVNCFRNAHSRLAQANTDQMLSCDWVTFRTFCAYLMYASINLIAKPDLSKHKTLNQSKDLHYLALTKPGMTLATRDKQMKALLPALSPGAKVISDPEDANINRRTGRPLHENA